MGSAVSQSFARDLYILIGNSINSCLWMMVMWSLIEPQDCRKYRTQFPYEVLNRASVFMY